ncbi:MAG: tetratricopeptide repeat protein, partial [Bacteroidales bacterium]|nr:tetratricopeptide repeat protein [Bacteroidales bacterium]
ETGNRKQEKEIINKSTKKGEKSMKTKNYYQNYLIMLPIVILMACSTLLFITCNGQKVGNKVIEAYELRMDGKADSAKVVLEYILTEDSTNSLAWYELCRTQQHIALANPRSLVEIMKDAMNNMNQAVKYEPENVNYLSYLGGLEAFDLYMGLQMGKEDVVEDLQKVEEIFLEVLDLKPDCYEVKLTLVEFFGMLPPSMGGDSAKAEKYARELEEADILFGAKAREILMPEDADYVIFWQGVNEKLKDDAEVLASLGIVYLYQDKVEEASKYFDEAISLDPEKNTLYLKLGMYYLMLAMQNQAQLDSVAPLIEKEFYTYLNSNPPPVKPMEAWVLSKLAMIKNRTGDQEGGEKLMAEANSLDSFHSKAFAIPVGYDPPDEISPKHGYFFRPF